MAETTASQKYLSTRGGSYGLKFEEVVLKGLASDGGLFIPENIPDIREEHPQWLKLSFEDLALKIFSLYISPSEISSLDLQKIIQKSYSTFRDPRVTPVVPLDPSNNLYLLELFHGPTFAFKDVALQFLGNVFEYFLVRHNHGKTGQDRNYLTVVGATSGDTGSAAIYGLRGKQDVSVFITYPHGKISPIQEAQMTTVLDDNVHCLAVDGTFDDCQDFVKALFGDEDINKTHHLAAVNSINWARILAQITYYFHSYASLVNSGTITSDTKVRFVVPTGNFGDILAGYFAKRMGLPVEKLVVATNANDILYRFWRSGYYETSPVHGAEANGGFAEDGVKAHEAGVKETLSPAMDILVSSNFERLLWFLAYQTGGDGTSDADRRAGAGERVRGWLSDLKKKGGFGVDDAIIKLARQDFESERVTDAQTLDTIRTQFSVTSPAATNGASTGSTGISSHGGYILDPHSAIGVAAAKRSISRVDATSTVHISLATAHPAKFSSAVEHALAQEKSFTFEDVLPEQFKGLEAQERRVTNVKKSDGLAGLRQLLRERVPSRG